MNIGENIYQYRKKCGMSQGDLADALDVSRQSVSKWETGSAVPELEKLVKMSSLFGISLDELVTGISPVHAVPEKAPISFSFILSMVLLTLSGISLLVTILFGNGLGIHTDEGVMLSLLFALIGIIIRKHQDTALFSLCKKIYLWILLIAAVAFVFRTFMMHRIMGFLLVYGIVLLIWWFYLRHTST